MYETPEKGKEEIACIELAWRTQMVVFNITWKLLELKLETLRPRPNLTESKIPVLTSNPSSLEAEAVDH